MVGNVTGDGMRAADGDTRCAGRNGLAIEHALGRAERYAATNHTGDGDKYACDNSHGNQYSSGDRDRNPRA